MNLDIRMGKDRSILTLLPTWNLLPEILFWAGILLLSIGFVSNALWREIAVSPTRLLSGLALVSVGAALLLARLVRCRFATAVLLVWLAGLICYVGLAPSVVVIVIAVAAMAIGSCFVPSLWQARAALSVLVGLSLMVGVIGWTLPFHIEHLREVYFAGMVVLIVWRWRQVSELLRPLPSEWSSTVAAAPLAAGLAMTAVGVVSTCAWLPTFLYDDLAYHIGLPAQMFELGYYQMNAASNVWALAGWSADVLHGIAWVVAGEESRGAVNTLWFALSAVLLWRVSDELELQPAMRWLAVALFAATPVLAYTLTSMQTEGPTVAVTFGLALLILRARLPDGRQLIISSVLFGLLVGLKVSNLWFAIPLGVWLLWRWRAHLSWRVFPLAFALAVVVAGSSYVYAYALTGNPVLPIFNDIFRSPFFAPIDFSDPRWHSGFSWNIVWRIVFHSEHFLEGGSAAASLTLIGLGGCFFVALARPRSRAFAFVAAVAFLLPLWVVQYLRYATPGLALLIPAVLCGVPVACDNGWLHQIRTVVLWLLVPLSLLFVTAVCWQFKGGVLQTFLSGGNAEVFAQFAPTRRVAEVIRNRYGDTARTLFLDPAQPYAAELAGKAFDVAWYDPTLWRLAAASDPEGLNWTRMFDLTGANLVVIPANNMLSGLPAAIQRSRGTLVYSVGGLNLWALYRGKPGTASELPNHGLALAFDVNGAPRGQTLVHGEFELSCNPEVARKGHIVVGWTIDEANGDHVSRYTWAQCTFDGRAHATLDLAVKDKVTGFNASVQPDPVMDMGLHLRESNGSLRNDLSAQRDLAMRLRHEIEFWDDRKLRMAAPSL